MGLFGTLSRKRFANGAVQRMRRGLGTVLKGDRYIYLLLVCTTTLSVASVTFVHFRGEAAEAIGSQDTESASTPPGVWWEHKALKSWKGCVNKPINQTKSRTPKNAKGYLRLTAQGDIHQQRQQICDAVALAHFLNAHLVLPELALSDALKENVTFNKVFDEDYFIDFLKKEISVVRPKDVGRLPLIEVNPPSQGLLSWYDENMREVLKEGYVVRLVSLADRLVFDNVPNAVQKMRCRACFHALQWAPPLVRAASGLVESMLDATDMYTNSNKFLSLHLRREEDVLEPSGCAPVAPPPQRDDTNSWAATLGFGGRSTSATASQSEESPAKVEKRHASGHCPLTLAEVAVFIKGLGYPPQTPIFVAGGAPPPTQGGLKALAKHFPNVYHKEAMLPEKDLLRFQGSSMQMAALDYITCLHSTVFVTMPGSDAGDDMLTGERAYFGRGLSIAPHKVAVVRVLLQFSHSKQLETIKRHVRQRHADAHELPRRKPFGPNVTRAESSVYRRPLPDCMCERSKNSFPDIGNTEVATGGGAYSLEIPINSQKSVPPTRASAHVFHTRSRS